MTEEVILFVPEPPAQIWEEYVLRVISGFEFTVTVDVEEELHPLLVPVTI